MDWDDLFDDEVFDDERFEDERGDDYRNDKIKYCGEDGRHHDEDNRYYEEDDRYYEKDDKYGKEDRDRYAEYLMQEFFEQKQALISKKSEKNAYSVERDYVNSIAFHDSFKKLPVNKNVQESLYKQAGRLLEFVDGCEGEERMLAVNARTGKFIVDNFNRPGSINGTGFTFEEERAIEICPDSVIFVHNHSLNGPPSAQDLLTYLKNDKLKISIIVCHDGTVYGIYEVKEAFEKFYIDCLNEAKKHTSDIDEAKLLARAIFYNTNNHLGKSNRLFDVRRL